MELQKLVLVETLNGQTKKMATLKMPLNTVMDSFTLLVMIWLHMAQKQRFISLILKGKKFGKDHLEGDVQGKN